MGHARKIHRTWIARTTRLLSDPKTPSRAVLQAWNDAKMHGEDGLEIRRKAERHPGLTKAHWVHMWAYAKDRWYPEQNPMLPLWLLEDPTFLSRQKEALKTYDVECPFFSFRPDNGELAESPVKVVAKLISDHIHGELMKESWGRMIFPVSTPWRAEGVADAGIEVAALMAPPPRSLKDLTALFEKHKASVSEENRAVLRDIAGDTEIDLTLAMELYLLGQGEVLDANPTVKLITLANLRWKEEAIELKKKREGIDVSGLKALLAQNRLRGDQVFELDEEDQQLLDTWLETP